MFTTKLSIKWQKCTGKVFTSSLLTLKSLARFIVIRKIKNAMKEENFFDLQAGDTICFITLFFVVTNHFTKFTKQMRFSQLYHVIKDRFPRFLNDILIFKVTEINVYCVDIWLKCGYAGLCILQRGTSVSVEGVNVYNFIRRSVQLTLKKTRICIANIYTFAEIVLSWFLVRNF